MQSAYEVLSDPQERAWYDSHRDTILRNEDNVSEEHYEHNVRITTAHDIIKVFTSFRGRSDFTDSDTGFYTALRRMFDTLAREEELACEWEGLGPITYPSFGYADDAYDPVVRPFYAAWNGFATKKSFTWVDVYRYSEAPDRRVRRLMEKENKRFREEGIREYNDAVRSLVAFVKKRDLRFKLNTQSESERQKLLRDTAVAQAARSRAANQVLQKQQETMPGWMKAHESPESESSDETEEAMQEQFECVVCKKNFKSEKQYESHEKSRKHVRAVQHLKKQMRQEEKNFRLQELNTTSAQQPDVSNFVESDEADVAPDIEAAVEQRDSISFSNSESDRESVVKIMDGSRSCPHGSTDNVSALTAADDSPESSSIDKYTTRERLKERIIGSPKEDVRKDTKDSESLDQTSGASAQPRMGKAKVRRAKKAAQKSTANAGSEADFKCFTCQARFTSKTRLFNHIKDLSHAKPVLQTAKEGKGKKL